MSTTDSPAKQGATSTTTERLLSAERQMLLQSRSDPGSAYFPGASTQPGRRNFMLSSMAAAGPPPRSRQTRVMGRR